MSSNIWKHHIDDSLINCTPQLLILKEIQSQKWMRSHNLYTGPPHQSINSYFHRTTKSLHVHKPIPQCKMEKSHITSTLNKLQSCILLAFQKLFTMYSSKPESLPEQRFFLHCKPTYFWLWFKQCVNKWPSTDKCAHIQIHTHYPLSVILTGNSSLNIHEEPPTHI